MTRKEFPQPGDTWIRLEAEVGGPWIYQMDDEGKWEIKVVKPEEEIHPMEAIFWPLR